ncbi:hypothetical protein, partial [Providencia rettgeri]|uniref:hypothetical protein n=1 Tax=Providencia rettgeri TaxID=587 RepID=UPI0032DB1BE4
MVGWHHQLNGHESESTPGVGDGQGGLGCCSPWDRKELDTTEQLNSTPIRLNSYMYHLESYLHPILTVLPPRNILQILD